MSKTAAFSALAAVVVSAGVALAATSADAWQCPPLTEDGRTITVGPASVRTCQLRELPIIPGCDPGPCDPTARAPQE